MSMNDSNIETIDLGIKSSGERGYLFLTNLNNVGFFLFLLFDHAHLVQIIVNRFENMQQFVFIGPGPIHLAYNAKQFDIKH